MPATTSAQATSSQSRGVFRTPGSTALGPSASEAGAPSLTARARLLFVGAVLATTVVAIALLVGAIYLFQLDVDGLGLGGILLAGHGLAVLLVIGVLLRRMRLPWASIGVRKPERSLWHLAWQIPAALTAAIAVQLSFASAFNLEPQNNIEILDNIPAITPLWVALLLLGGAVLAPLWEELIFRGVILDGLARRSLTLGVLLSAALFALMHAGIHAGTPFLFVMGINLALLTRFYRSIWGAVVLHVANNALVISAVIAAVVAP